MFRLSLRALLAAASVTTSVCAADPSDPAALVRPLEHRSVLDTYRTDPAGAVGNWREANDAVGPQAGGHTQGHGSAAAAPPDPHAGHDHGAQAAADPHAGHGAATPDHSKAADEAKPHHCPHHAAHHEQMHGHMHGRTHDAHPSGHKHGGNAGEATQHGGGHGATKSGHGHTCHHDSKEGGDAHKH